MGRLIPIEAWWSCSWTSSGNTLDCWFRTKHGIHTSCRQLCDCMHCPRGCQSDYCEQTRFQVQSVVSGTSGEAVALWLVICLGTREVYVLVIYTGINRLPVMYTGINRLPVIYTGINRLTVIYTGINRLPVIYTGINRLPVIYTGINRLPVIYTGLNRLPVIYTGIMDSLIHPPPPPSRPVRCLLLVNLP